MKSQWPNYSFGLLSHTELLLPNEVDEITLQP